MIEETKRLAVVLGPSLAAGPAANVAAIVAGGLRCAAFSEPIRDASGTPHSAVRWNVIVLKTKSSGQLRTLVEAAKVEPVELVVFSRSGASLSNSFPEYEALVKAARTEDLEVTGVGLFGPDAVVRALTRSFSVYG